MARSDIGSMVNRSLGGGVLVYSPTRRIVRPTGRVANAGTAQAILGGGPVEQPRIGTSSFGGATQRLPGWTQALGGGGMPGAMPAAGGGFGTTLDQIRREAGIAPAPEVEEPGGFWGSGIGKALGTAVNNPIGRGLMTGLEALNYPRRVVQSSVQEVVDAFNGGDASFDDWTQQIGDESFGFDNMVPDTGNSFLDGLIGFGGDMLLDPTTYVGGAGLWSGIAGRSARAGTAATARSLGVKVAGLTVEETEERLARWGFSRFSNAARAELREQLPGTAGRILDRGYHFKVPLTQRFFQLPGTAPVDWLLSRGAGRVRDTLSRSPLGGWMRYASNPNNMRDAVTTMVTRRPTGGLNFAQAAEVINWNNGAKLAERSFSTKATKMADDVVKQLGGGNRGREAANDLFRTAEAKGGTAIHGYWEALRKMARDEYGVNIPEFDGPYLPHFRTKEGSDLLDAGGSAAARDFNVLFKETDLDAPASVKLQRQLVAGKSIKIAGTEHQLLTGSADEINQIFRKALGVDVDLIDTDFASVTGRYIKSLQENVRTIGGIKKVLGSKSGLVHRLGDESILAKLSDDEIDAISSKLTASALKGEKRRVDSTLRQMRDDTHRGITSISGPLGVEMRDKVNNMATVSAANKTILDGHLARMADLEDQVGVGKYHERFADGDPLHGPPGRPGVIQREYEAAHKAFSTQLGIITKRWRTLEEQRGKLATAASAEARRLEAQGGVGATPIQEELRRVAAETAVTSSDMEYVQAIVDRLDVNQKAQGVINARLGDQDFINLSVGDNLSPKSPGSPTGAATEAPPVYVGPDPAQISTDFNAKRTDLLGATDQQVAEVAARYNVQVGHVAAARDRRWRAELNYREPVDTAHDALLEGRRYEAALKYEVDRTAGKPDLLQRNLEYSDRLEAFQEGDLKRLQRDYVEAKRPIEDARSNFAVEERKLQQVRDEQMAIARNMDARVAGAETSTDFSWAAQHPIGDPVDPTPAITDRRQAAQQFVDLPDDALVTVYHATSKANADRLLAGRQIDPTMAGSSTGIATPAGELYVGGMYDQSGGYGDTTLAITVRKRDLRPSPEAGSSDYQDADWFAEFGDDAAVTQGLFLSRHLGATLKDLNDVADIRVVTKGAPVTINRSPQRLPLTATQEATLKSQRRRVVRERNKWQRTPEGVAHTKATKALNTVNQTLEATNRQITEISGKGGRFFVDADGAMQPKFTTQEQWALDLINHRRDTLIPARNAAEARLAAANETRARLERSGVDLWGSSSEAKAAQAEASAAFKARQEANYAITKANRDLGKVKDVPDLGQITRQTDELNQLLTKQASQQARVDELTQQLATTGQPLRDFEDGITGINSQLQLQQAARDAAAEAPATPYGAQVAASHRAEQQRLDQIEASFAAPRNWEDPVEMAAAPGDLGRFEGKFEDPTIRRAMDLINRVDGRRRLFDDMDEATDLANSAAAIRAAAEPFTVPPKGTPAHTAVMEFSPASRGGAMGAVDRAQNIVTNTQRVLDRHIPELVEAGALPTEYADELFRQRLDLDRALDLHAANPTAANRADVTAKATELGRLTEFALRYKQALDGGNEASPGLASFILAQQFDAEAVSLRSQIDIGNARLASPMGGTAELKYSRGLARLNERAVQLSDNIEKEIAKARTGGAWNKTAVEEWSSELQRVQRQVDGLGQPANGVLDDAVDSHAAYLADKLRDTNDAEAIFNNNRFVDHRMQWPVRRKDELTAEIPHVEAEVLGHKQGQARLTEAVRRAHASGSTTVRYTPYSSEGYPGKVAVMSLAQAEQNLVANDAVIRRVEHDLVNKQIQLSALEGTVDQRITLIERELSDVDVPPNPVELALENDTIRATAQREQRQLTPGELETVASNQTRIERLNRGQPLPQSTVADMRDELGRLTKVRDDYAELMGGDAAHISVARDPEGFLRGVVAGGGPISERSMAMLSDLVGAETAAAAKTWIHYLDETFAGRTAVGADELDELVADAVGVFGDNELIERMRTRAAASLDVDGSVSLDEMRDEFTAALAASANRQRGESMRETLSHQKLFGTTYIDTPGGLRPRLIDAVADEPSHQLLTARLRSHTLDTMQAKGYDPRNALVDEVADLRTRLGRVETMRRGIEGNEEYLDVLLTGTPSAQARAQTRATLQAGSEALAAEEGQLVAEGVEAINRLDPDRAARSLEQQTQLAKQASLVDDQMTSLQRQVDSLQRQKDQAERTYTERLNEAGLQLANVRRKAHEAQVNYDTFEAHRNQLLRALDVDPGKKTPAMRAAVDDLKALNQARRELDVFDEADINAIDARLTAYAEDLAKMDATKSAVPDEKALLAQAQKDPKQMAKVIKGLLSDDWRIHAKGIGVDDPEGYIIDAGLARAIENVEKATSQHAFWTFLDRYTAFFKTYATAKPGFHVRNAMSASFMNLVDGVRIRDMYQGARLWRQYERNPNFLATADQRVKDAFAAVAGSGAGGRYMEAAYGVNIQAGTKMYQRVMDNAFTRWNQRLGSHVEGSARLAMALNTLERGGNAEQAMQRIAKFHFDYTEMSDLDRMARRFIPFWTFMSRNLPLQLEQMLTNPRMYVQYQNLKRNFGETADPATPGYWLSAGAFTVDKHAETRESPWYIAPDLPHLQVTEPLDAMMQGEWGKALLSDVNPLLLAPLEAGAIGHKVFSGANLEGYEETSAANPFVPLFNLIGAATPFDATATAGSGQTVIDKRAAHVARSLLPPWEFAERLLDPTGKRAGRTDETIYRALGLPVRQLNDELRRGEERSRYYDRREEHDRQADLARM